MPHGGPHARAGEFVNRRTKQPISVGTPYHLHEGQAMEGAVHSEIQGGTMGHDFFDRVNGRNNMPHNGSHYKIAGTDKEWTGNVVFIAGEPFSSVGGGIEGDRQLLERKNGSNQEKNITNQETQRTETRTRTRTQTRRTQTRRTQTSGGGMGGGRTGGGY
mgnify:CR=1 FL=1